MALTEEQLRLIFGIKLRQLRAQKDLSLHGLTKLTGLSKSYLNEIEKGKKYPKPDKILALAQALEVPYDELVSMQVRGSMAPVRDIIASGILKDIPLSLFGIEEGDLIDIIANAPEKVSAFIRTLFEISRHYNVSRESFYLAALRSYQEMYENYFPDIEEQAVHVARRYQLDLQQKLSSHELEEILVGEFDYRIDYDSLGKDDFPQEIRSLFIPSRRQLLIASNVSETQKVFILAKELGYASMKIQERPLTFTWIRFSTFEEVLNNFRASYFAGALILPEKRLLAEIKLWLKRDSWDAEAFLQWMLSYTDSAETFFQRLTNLLSRPAGLSRLYFLRMEYDSNKKRPQLNKELHLNGIHQPQGLNSSADFCRRWLSVDVLLKPKDHFGNENIRLDAQISRYPDSEHSYLVISASQRDPFKEHALRSVCLGIELNASQRKKFAFLKDDQLSRKDVGITCQSCPIADCQERVAPAVELQKKERNKEIEMKVTELTQA